MTRTRRLVAPAVAGWVILLSSSTTGVDLVQYGFAKGQRFVQTNAGSAVAIPTNRFYFIAFVEAAATGAVTQASLVDPFATTNELTPIGPRELALERFYPDSTQLEAAFPTGTYTFLVGTLHDGDLEPALEQPAAEYPNAPRISNWSAAQVINAPLDFTLRWDAFTNGTSRDFIELRVLDSLDQEVFRTSDSFHGTNRSVLIPGGTFTTGQTYRATLLFQKNVRTETNAVPGSTGLVAFQSETEFSLLAPVPTPVSFTNRVLPAAEIGNPYVASLGLSGGVAPHTFFILEGRLPLGLSITDTGELVGTPNEPWTLQNPSRLKTFKFVVNVTDTFHATASQQFVLQVAKPLALVTTRLPTAQRNKPYRANLRAIRGKKPYQWSITAGTLPSGLELDSATGRIAGTPSVIGGFPLIIRVTDDVGVTISRPLTLIVE